LLVLPDGPALLALNVNGSVEPLIDAELRLITIDEHDRIWAVDRSGGRQALVGQR
jgi:hypothetical protein